jgi:hypothetical protein
MGYTHYWYRKPEIPAETFARIRDDFARLLPELAQRGVRLGDAWGKGQPVVNDEAIAFNGAKPEDYESFYLEPHSQERRDERGLCFAFCKTARRPYDLAVTACLIVFRHHIQGEGEVHTDGMDAEWSAARDLCQRVLGYGAEYRVDKDYRLERTNG